MHNTDTIKSFEYYNKNSTSFFHNTVVSDMSTIREPFIRALPGQNLNMLDAGCGSGRDTKYFRSLGHHCIGLDASEKMVDLSSEHTGTEIMHSRFEDMDIENYFDAIWACASLIHVPKSRMVDVLGRFLTALVPGGVMYISVREGTDHEEIAHERLWNYYSEESMRELLGQYPNVTVIDIWSTRDVREPVHDYDFSNDFWLNVLFKKE